MVAFILHYTQAGIYLLKVNNRIEQGVKYAQT